jgi:hypothetical protein
MRFDYLQPAIDEVIKGFEDRENIYALEQAEYKPIRTLKGENGLSAIYRCALTREQRQMVAEGADVLIEILHFGGPLAPSRVMLLNQTNAEESGHWRDWLVAQLKLV